MIARECVYNEIQLTLSVSNPGYVHVVYNIYEYTYQCATKNLAQEQSKVCWLSNYPAV